MSDFDSKGTRDISRLIPTKNAKLLAGLSPLVGRSKDRQKKRIRSRNLKIESELCLSFLYSKDLFESYCEDEKNSSSLVMNKKP